MWPTLQRVQAGGDQSLHALRQYGLVGDQAAVCKQAHEFLRIQWVATGPFENSCFELRAEHRDADEMGDELSRLPIGER